MAMTKKEMAEMIALRNNYLKARALSWPSYKPIPIDAISAWDTMEKEVHNGCQYIPAWTFNVNTEMETAGGFSPISHFKEHPLSWSQGRSGPWYKTRKEALMALRIALTENYAGTLALIDQKIDNCEV